MGKHSHISLLILISALLAIITLPISVAAKTWYVKHDGTGAAPTIRAAVDSSVSGDTVLVGPGTYELAWPIRIMNKGLVVTSEHGPYETRLVPWPGEITPHAFSCVEIFTSVEISGFWIEGFRWGFDDQGAINVSDVRTLYIRNNVMINNKTAIAIDRGFPARAYIEQNTIANNFLYGIIGGFSSGWVANNIIWDRATEMDWFLISCNCMLDVSDAGPMAGLNFGDDPQFCGTPENGNVYLQSDSPCVPGNSPIATCGLVGAMPVRCGTAPIKATTWGELKNLYR